MGRRGAKGVLGLIGVLGSGRGRRDGGGMKTGFRVKARIDGRVGSQGRRRSVFDRLLSERVRGLRRGGGAFVIIVGQRGRSVLRRTLRGMA